MEWLTNRRGSSGDRGVTPEFRAKTVGNPLINGLFKRKDPFLQDRTPDRSGGPRRENDTDFDRDADDEGLRRAGLLVLLAPDLTRDETSRPWSTAVVPKAPPMPTLLGEAAMLARSRKAVLEGADWLTAAKVAELAGLRPTNPSTQSNKWKLQRQIFAIHHNGIDYVSGYGLEPEAGWRPRKTLKSALEVFGDDKGGWAGAYWFLSGQQLTAQPQRAGGRAGAGHRRCQG